MSIREISRRTGPALASVSSLRAGDEEPAAVGVCASIHTLTAFDLVLSRQQSRGNSGALAAAPHIQQGPKFEKEKTKHLSTT